MITREQQKRLGNAFEEIIFVMRDIDETGKHKSIVKLLDRICEEMENVIYYIYNARKDGDTE